MRKELEVFQLDQPEGKIVFVPEARHVYTVPLNTVIPDKILGEPKGISLSKIPDHKFVNTEILLNNNCNLRCIYCYADAGTRPTKEEISEKVALSAVEQVAYNAKEIGMPEFHVIMAGGEPTLSFGKIFLITRHAQKLSRKLGLNLTIGVVSNGTFNSKIRDFLSENMTFVNISLDGPKEIHDAQRPTIAGKGSFDTVYRNARWFNDHSTINLGIRATIPLEQTENLVEIVSYIHKEFPHAVIGLDGVQECGRCHTTNTFSPNWLLFAKEFVKVIQLAIKEGIAISNGFTRFFGNSDDINFCGADGRNFTITPGGYAGSCARIFSLIDDFADLFLFGHYDSKTESFIFDMSRYQNLKMQISRKNPKCFGCFAKYNCKGDCPHLKLSSGLKLDDLSPRCEAIRYITLQQLRLSLGLPILS